MTLVCPECGASFAPTHPRQAFCTRSHAQRFHNRNKARGQVLLPLAQLSRAGKSGFNDQKRWALRQYNALVDAFNREDKAAGRRPDLAVSRKMAKGWAAADVT